MLSWSSAAERTRAGTGGKTNRRGGGDSGGGNGGGGGKDGGAAATVGVAISTIAVEEASEMEAAATRQGLG